MRPAGRSTIFQERRLRFWVGGVAAAATVAWMVLFGTSEREATQRCPDGLVAQGPRCCGAGQLLSDGHCRGIPQSCPSGMDKVTRGEPGCVIRPQRIAYDGGRVVLGSSDWESEGVVEPRTIEVGPFELDANEVTIDAWRRCETAGVCRNVDVRMEPGQPVTGIRASEAALYCSYVGGRLPTRDEWTFAAMGTKARRFAWGMHGLVCRRAVYGLESGPCETGATGPELAGARPAGKSPEGALDLTGNVAEWTRDSDGATHVLGGSYRSKLAQQLKTWAEARPRAAVDVGFRCAYGGDR